jgi:hypothetical protein
MRVGLDIHGVIDKHPELFSFLSITLIMAGHEVHIITGQKISRGLIADLHRYNMVWTKIHSITDYNERRGVKVTAPPTKVGGFYGSCPCQRHKALAWTSQQTPIRV